MKSETRTKKLFSSIKRKLPKNNFAKAGVGVLALGVVIGTPVVSAMAIREANNSSSGQSQSIQAPTTTAVADTTATANEEPTTDPQPTEPTPPASTTNPSPTNPAPNPTPTPPPAPVFNDTYPAEWISQCGALDTWGMTKCQSVSYTAWKVSESFGNMPKWGYMGNADAKNWPSLATKAGITTGTTPRVHSVGVVNNATTGYTAWIEAIDGNNVIVTHYNLNNSGAFKQSTVPASYFSTYIYFN